MYRIMLSAVFMILLSGCKTDRKHADMNNSGYDSSGSDEYDFDNGLEAENAAPIGCGSFKLRMTKYHPDIKQRHANFIRMARAAYHCGDPHPAAVAAQWIEETGWGRSISGDNNFFGIKATEKQSGKIVRTTEYTGNKRLPEYGKFLNYPTPIAGVKGRVDFVKKNERYTRHGYFRAKNPKEAAYALREACWGACNTDTGKPAPNAKGQYYDDVLVAHIKTIRYNGKKLSPYRPLRFQIELSAEEESSVTSGSAADARGLN